MDTSFVWYKTNRSENNNHNKEKHSQHLGESEAAKNGTNKLIEV